MRTGRGRGATAAWGRDPNRWDRAERCACEVLVKRQLGADQARAMHSPDMYNVMNKARCRTLTRECSSAMAHVKISVRAFDVTIEQ